MCDFYNFESVQYSKMNLCTSKRIPNKKSGTFNPSRLLKSSTLFFVNPFSHFTQKTSIAKHHEKENKRQTFDSISIYFNYRLNRDWIIVMLAKSFTIFKIQLFLPEISHLLKRSEPSNVMNLQLKLRIHCSNM